MIHAHYVLLDDYTIRIMRDQIMDLQDGLYRTGEKKCINLIRYMKKNNPGGQKAIRNKKER